MFDPLLQKAKKARTSYEQSSEYDEDRLKVQEIERKQKIKEFAEMIVGTPRWEHHRKGPVFHHILSELTKAQYRVISNKDDGDSYEIAFHFKGYPTSGILLSVGQKPVFLGVPEDVGPFAGTHITAKAAVALLEATNCQRFTFRQLEVVLSILRQFQVHQLPALFFELALLRPIRVLAGHRVIPIHDADATVEKLAFKNVPEKSMPEDEEERTLSKEQIADCDYKLQLRLARKLFSVWVFVDVFTNSFD